MVRFVPHINPSRIRNSSERIVAEALANQIDDDVTVIHSFSWVRELKSGILKEGECDFIVLSQHGLLFFEVKGGILKFDTSINQWARMSNHGDWTPLDKDPYIQLQGSMHTVMNRLRENLGILVANTTYGYAFVFPNGKFSGNLPPNVTRTQIIDAPGIQNLQQSMKNVLNKFTRNSSQLLSEDVLEKIERALYPAYEIVPVLWQKVEQSEKRLYRLTENQKGILEMLSRHNTAAIRGGAGTGKTLLALAKAQEKAQSGFKTLVLCYNRPLRDWLVATATQKFDEPLSIMTYHELVHIFCERARLDFNPTGKDAFWSDEAPELLEKACRLLQYDDKYDAVIVDEGQDFKDLWWLSLDGVFRDSDNKGCFYVFYDPMQNIYVANHTELPSELGESYLLKKNCRNSPEIANYCSSVLKDETLESELSDLQLSVHTVNSREAGFSRISEIVNRLCSRQNKLQFSQVVVLVPGYPNKDWPKNFKFIKVTESLEEWRANQAVLISSYARFKGLESDAVVILTDPVENLEGRMRVLHYVASSRAKHILEIVELNKS